MKTALVVEWPSVDAPAGSPFNEWDWKVTDELLKAAGLSIDLVTSASSRYAKDWRLLWENGRVGTKLTAAAQADVDALHERLKGYDMALTLGSHALYALTGEVKIDTYRGCHLDSPFVEGLQVVPTYSPMVYARLAWNERPIVVSAMQKAKRRFEDRTRTIYLPDTVADLYWFSTKFIDKEIVFDVETNVETRITEFSLATSSDRCLYVQLEDRAFRSMWSEEDEQDIWLWLHFLSLRKDLAWGFHNATYDLTYLDKYGIRPRGHIFDTMLRHHAWQPEWEKSLGFLAGLHIPTRAWKHLRKKAKADFNKAGAL